MASHKVSSGVPVYTQCQIQNHAGKNHYVTLELSQYWHGSADPPKTVQDQNAGNFQQNADAGGAMGGVAYALGDTLKWIIAWRNAENLPNKVYTQILSGDEAIDWAKIKTNLDNSGNQSSDHNKFGYSSVATIDQDSSTPTVTATLTPVA